MTETSPVIAGGGTGAAISYRPVRADELAECAEVWRDGINDYTRRLNQPDVPPETASLLRLYAHLQSTDPERFVVATMPSAETAGGERIVAFAAAVMRERLWFLSMLFVRPGLQGAGLGRALLARVAPADGEASFRATATDSAQPISNALYASAGIVPRIPLLNFIGLPQDPAAFGTLPSGIVPTAFAQLVGEPGGEGHQRLAGAVDALDREVLGVAHPADHRFLRQENRTGWLYRGPDGATEGYGYASEAGRIGPVAVRDPALLAPILGHLTSAVIPRGAFALWLPGTADRAVVPALRSGFRLDQFPVLLCWDQPFADLTRYLPISPGLL
ncbi:MAG: GCN5-related N-acetyltransferase [Chloroflexota bacterium]|nr:GCN5-related N-acetyltransferase [Chloroflexota bacterium]